MYWGVFPISHLPSSHHSSPLNLQGIGGVKIATMKVVDVEIG